MAASSPEPHTTAADRLQRHHAEHIGKLRAHHQRRDALAIARHDALMAKRYADAAEAAAADAAAPQEGTS